MLSRHPVVVAVVGRSVVWRKRQQSVVLSLLQYINSLVLACDLGSRSTMVAIEMGVGGKTPFLRFYQDEQKRFK